MFYTINIADSNANSIADVNKRCTIKAKGKFLGTSRQQIYNSIFGISEVQKNHLVLSSDAPYLIMIEFIVMITA